MLNQMLFIAEFYDGSIYRQNSQDKSLYGGINCFSDIKDKKIKKFMMIGCGHQYTWDLIFGSLTIDDAPPIFPPVEFYPGMPVKLIYQRITQQQMTNSFQAQKEKKSLFWKRTDTQIKSSCVGYLVGFEFLRNGKNVNWTMTIKIS